ncbi:MAG: MBL fold metallo-hydrolase [Clostridiales Family XIII bacterium]|jgi:glyoxylase-like metal-dependent hydrolase (beta-lactamase superfamily II)|nr:MBL fold metallo-hydrolase [Clostridiales Family XIII bacterium]
MLLIEKLTVLPSGLGIHFIGSYGGDAWVLEKGGDAVLLDAGFPFCAEQTAQEAARILDGRPPGAILLSHSHYDHIGGVAAYRRAFPGAPVYAAAGMQKVCTSETAHAMMKKLNATAASYAGLGEGPDFTDGLAIDRVAAEGDRITCGALSCAVWETPGHTNDSLGFYFEADGLLTLTETAGIFARTPAILSEPAVVVSWKKSLACVRRAREAAPGALLLSHSGVLQGAEVGEYLDSIERAILFTKDLVFQRAKEGRPPEETVMEFKALFFDKRPGAAQGMQPPDAFLANYAAMVPRILAEGE